MLESRIIVFVAARGRVSGMHGSKITARGRSGGRVTTNTFPVGTRAVSHRVTARGSVSGMHVIVSRCIAARGRVSGMVQAQYHHPGHCAVCQVCTQARASPGVVSGGRVTISA